KYKDALKYYIAAIKIDKNYVLAWKKIGFCYYQLKNHDMANKAFQKVISLSPNDTEAKQFVSYYNSLQEREKKLKEPKNMLDPMWRAAILPGWGQYHNHQYVKGMVITGAFVAALGLTIYSVMDEKAKYEKYLNTNENHDLLYNEAQGAYNTALILGIVTVAIYAGSIVDAALNYDCIEARTADIKIINNTTILCKNFRW
ncbi:MAG: tetratricopeptide repeat protein, partial [Candidatus Goldbacteria bacterium]|nr:tetratricopeptide repeat protein [Candidatus Goldiibacteriota bacterium]